LEFETLFKQHYKDNKINYFRITEYPHGYDTEINNTKNKYSYKVRDGKDLTIVALGNKLKEAIKAANILNEEHKIECDIVYFNAIRPFEPEIFLKSISKTKKFICIEELSKSGGLYEDCLKSSLEIHEKINSIHLSISDFIHDYGSYEELSFSAGLSVENIILRARELIK